ncbi:MAG: hypothetical protein P8J18_05470 [Halieaceae bacterium]|nr:hypothetical protein [Halieaceae bacterium]
MLDFEYPDKEVIVLRNRDPKDKKKSIPIPYKDSDFEFIVSMRDEVHQYNKLLWRTHIDPNNSIAKCLEAKSASSL